MKCPNSIGRLHRAVNFIRPYRYAVPIILILTFAVAGLNAVEPLVLKYLFDELGEGRAARPLVLGLSCLLGLIVLREICAAISNWLTWRTRLGVHFLLLDATVERIQRMPVSFHRNQAVGGIMTRLDRGIQGFLGAVSEISFNALPALVYLGIAVHIMVRLDLRLACIVLAFTPLPIIITALASPEFIRRERTLLESWMKIYSRFNEVLSGIVTVKSFAMEDEERRRFLRDVNAANRVVVRGVGIDTKIGAAQNLVLALARISAIAAGGIFILRGETTLGTLVAFLGFLGGLFGPVQGLSNILKTLRTASVSLETIFSILDAPDHLQDKPQARDIGQIRGAVHFNKVRFAYDPKGRRILDGIDVKVEAGEVIALVGPSGTGKSTLMSLLQRLYDPIEGSVLVDGVDIRQVRQRSLRSQIGVVLQDPLLFNDTVRNNIAYGKPHAGPADIFKVAKIANAHDFIKRLPQKYETIIGERGGRLSAGERQRIAIARALLKDPPILILDEATSALDSETEILVQKALEVLIRGRTTFIIAHRLSTVISADRILVLKDGRILEQGAHQELMARKGYYASLVWQQGRGLLPMDSPGLAEFEAPGIRVIKS